MNIVELLEYILSWQKKEIEKASEVIKMNTLDTVLLLAISAIRDEFDYGPVRLKRLINRMEKKATLHIS